MFYNCSDILAKNILSVLDMKVDVRNSLFFFKMEFDAARRNFEEGTRILEWVFIMYVKGSSYSKILPKIGVPYIVGTPPLTL